MKTSVLPGLYPKESPSTLVHYTCLRQDSMFDGITGCGITEGKGNGDRKQPLRRPNVSLDSNCGSVTACTVLWIPQCYGAGKGEREEENDKR